MLLVYRTEPTAVLRFVAIVAKHEDMSLGHGVGKLHLGVTGIVFYTAGECCGISVDRPALVTFSDTDGEFKIKVCEPTNKADTLNVTVAKSLKLKAADRRYTVVEGNSTRLTLDTSLSVGEAYEAVFEIL